MNTSTIRIENQTVRTSMAATLCDPATDHKTYFWWLGQAGFALRYKTTLLLIDPYLSDSLAEKYRDSEFKHLRMMRIPVAPCEVKGAPGISAPRPHRSHGSRHHPRLTESLITRVSDAAQS
ncbi:MAG: hypothetical protein R2844_10985 [Caldilineales bacterium]